MKLDNPPNQNPIAGEMVPTRPFAIWFEQVVKTIRGGDAPVIRTSPDGTRYRLEVGNGGVTLWVAI